LVGNKKSVFEKIIGKIGVTNEVSYHHIELPFCNVEDFDYSTIAKNINKLNPNFIWVSLGAPKQEIFMKNIEKYINNGTLFGVGAAFNFFSGEIQNIPKWVKTFKLIWIQRLLLEPKKQKERIITIIRYLPKILLEEIQEIKKRNKNKTSL
jgi:N-acetylglucosaminyldiphosphoundecaprenol N-acetyl-beta-D-mannosaminyltransferase